MYWKVESCPFIKPCRLRNRAGDVRKNIGLFNFISLIPFQLRLFCADGSTRGMTFSFFIAKENIFNIRNMFLTFPKGSM